MTRDEILESYTVVDGVIRSLGKFEGEPEYAPYFYEATLDGTSDILDWPDDGRTDIVEVSDKERAMWPTLESWAVAVAIEESDQGFVSVTSLTQREVDQLTARNEKAWEDEPSEDESEESDDESEESDDGPEDDGEESV